MASEDLTNIRAYIAYQDSHNTKFYSEIINKYYQDAILHYSKSTPTIPKELTASFNGSNELYYIHFNPVVDIIKFRYICEYYSVKYNMKFILELLDNKLYKLTINNKVV